MVSFPACFISLSSRHSQDCGTEGWAGSWRPAVKELTYLSLWPRDPAWGPALEAARYQSQAFRVETSASLSNRGISESFSRKPETNKFTPGTVFTARSWNAAEVLSGPRDRRLVWPLSGMMGLKVFPSLALSKPPKYKELSTHTELRAYLPFVA